MKSRIGALALSVTLGGAVFLPLVAACSSGYGTIVYLNGDGGSPGDGNTPSGDGSSQPVDSSSGMSANGELSIVSLTATTGTLTDGPASGETASVTFIAIVTDSNGLDTIAGGQLMDDSGTTYAAFGAGANKSTFSASLDYATMNGIHKADYPPSGGQRTFVAKFFDNKKNEVTAQVVLGLQCRSTEYHRLGASCAGTCIDVAADITNCGSCGKTCSDMCVAGACGIPTSVTCVSDTAFSGSLTCAQVCKAAGKTCVDIVQYTDSKCAGTANKGGAFGCGAWDMIGPYADVYETCECS
jgi:hypothetical protein